MAGTGLAVFFRKRGSRHLSFSLSPFFPHTIIMFKIQVPLTEIDKCVLVLSDLCIIGVDIIVFFVEAESYFSTFYPLSNLF